MPPVKETEFYDLLEVDADASVATIKRNYRRLSKTCHPDLFPNDPAAAEKFNSLTEARDTLVDEHKRDVYNNYGKKGLNEAGDPFRGAPFFPDMFPHARRSGPIKGEDIIHHIMVSLEDLYRGKTCKMSVKKKVPCTWCKGKGTRNHGEAMRCSGCSGSGIKIRIHQVGPAMLQQIKSVCSDCLGKKEIIKEEDKCEGCKGAKVVDNRKVLQVYVEKGMRDKQTIKFPGESDQNPGEEPGDIIFMLKQKEHPHFRRDGNNLYMEHKITLMEALGGTSFAINHLDGRTLIAKTEEGSIIKPGDLLVIPKEGMPIHKQPFEKGNLFIRFDVVFPDSHSLKPSQLKVLASVLPPGTPPPKYENGAENVEEVTLAKVDGHEFQQHNEERHEAYEEEEDEQREEGVQCHQQ